MSLAAVLSVVGVSSSEEEVSDTAAYRKWEGRAAVVSASS